MMTGLCLGKSFEWEDDKQQYYKVTESSACHEELYAMFKDAKKIDIDIENDIEYGILKDDLWKVNKELALISDGQTKKSYKLQDKSEEIKLICQMLTKVGIECTESDEVTFDVDYAIRVFQGAYEKPSKDGIHDYNWNDSPDGIFGKSSLLALDEAVTKEWKYQAPDCVTEWKNGYHRNIDGQNTYSKEIAEAALAFGLDAKVFKALIAQESGFDPKASNQLGYAGLTQIGHDAIKETILNTGTSDLKAKDYKETDSKGKSIRYKYDDNDERFDAKKSIIAGARVFKNKIKSMDSFFKRGSYSFTAEFENKLYVGAYKGGQGTMQEAVDGCTNIPSKWEDLLNSKKMEDSALYEAIPKSWGKKAKYKEISEYVDYIFKRAGQ